VRASFPALTLAIAAIGIAQGVLAQQPLGVPRADGHTTPLLVYSAAGAPAACAPLAVLSHGAGGSEVGYQYLAQAMANLGYTTVVMGHRESGSAALRTNMAQDGLMPGVRALVADRSAEQARLLDVGAALQWADAQCRAPFRVLLGHDMVEPLVTQTVVSFLAGVRRNSCPLPPSPSDMKLVAK